MRFFFSLRDVSEARAALIVDFLLVFANATPLDDPELSTDRVPVEATGKGFDSVGEIKVGRFGGETKNRNTFEL